MEQPGREQSASVAVTELTIETGGVVLGGTLAVPANADGLVLFAHGSGSSRFSRRNRYVAEVLQDAGFATLLFDLLTPGEDEVDATTRQYRFDIPLLASRLTGAIDWSQQQDAVAGSVVGLFGASTGAAAALIAAADRPERVRAVVSRGGRADLAGAALARVRCPTLLLVGSEDAPVIELNETARQALAGPVQLHIIRGAGHLFEERGKLEEVARQAAEWFSWHLRSPGPRGG